MSVLSFITMEVFTLMVKVNLHEWAKTKHKNKHSSNCTQHSLLRTHILVPNKETQQHVPAVRLRWETRDSNPWKAQSLNSQRPLNASTDHHTEVTSRRRRETNMSDMILSWLNFAHKETRCWRCFVWLLFQWQPRNMKTTILEISPKRSSCLSPLRMDWPWIITQQRVGRNRSNIWNWVCVCTGFLKTAWDTACCTVIIANMKKNRPLRETQIFVSTGTLWWERPVRGSAERISPRCSCLLPAERSWRTSGGDPPTDICTLRIPGWDTQSLWAPHTNASQTDVQP